MRKIRGLAIVAALLLTVSSVATVLADPPPTNTDNEDYHLTILAGGQLSVEIIDSGDFEELEFSLTNAPLNWTDSAFYSLEVVDGRGSGAGWNVVAEATPFSPAVPGTQLYSSNNGPWSGLCLPSPIPDGFCSGTGSIRAGVGIVPGHQQLITTGGASIFFSAAGTPSGIPNGTGTFQTQEALYYNGFPVALAAGTYTTTLTLTISGTAP